MRKSALVAAMLMFGASFALVAGVYDALPAELPMFRNPFAGVVTVAPKSAFTVLRVPAMNLLHGLMAAVMLARTGDFKGEGDRASYFAFFSTFLFAIALKSDFEALEVSSLAFPPGSLGRWATAGTVISVAGGLILALVRGRVTQIPWRELRLSGVGAIMLIGLCGSYLAIVAASILIAHRE